MNLGYQIPVSKHDSHHHAYYDYIESFGAHQHLPSPAERHRNNMRELRREFYATGENPTQSKEFYLFLVRFLILGRF